MTDENVSTEVEQSNLGSLRIDPQAEPVQSAAGGITAQQENDFYKKTGAQFQLAHNQQNLGVLGKFFGSNSSAPTNIAGFVIICSFLIFCLSLFFPANTELVESRKWLIGLISSAMSFIFGAASKK